MIHVVAIIGSKALYFLYAWLIGCILASTAAGLKGYAERWGLVTGMLTSLLGGVIWMFFPARRESRWDRAIKPTDLVTVAGGFLLGTSAFLDWFDGETLLTARLWAGLIVCIAAALAVTHVLMAASEAGPGWILGRGRTVVLALGALALVVVAYNLASPPDDASLKSGAYVGVVGALLVVVGPALGRLAPFPRASQMEHGALPG